MLDVLHFYFESDNTHDSEEAMKSQDGIRRTVYRDLYDQEFKYAAPSKGQGNLASAEVDKYDDDLSDIKPFDPLAKKETLPRQPLTQIQYDSPTPFGDVLDAPMR